MKKLVIFDLDGTLLNTIEDLGQAANYALERNGYATHSMASYPYFVGNGVRRLMTRVLPEDARDDDMGVAVAVASNKYQKAVSKIIPHFFPDINFVAIEGHREGVNVKPDPSVVFSILADARMAKADCLYVGDSGVDMETARRACIDSVGLDIVENGIRIS